MSNFKLSIFKLSIFKVMALFSVAETGAAFASPALLARFRAELSNETPDETPMALSPDRRDDRARAAARFWFVRTSPLKSASAAGYHTRCP
jgi:hypothetical protein